MQINNDIYKVFFASSVKYGNETVIRNLELMKSVHCKEKMEGYLQLYKNVKLNINHIYNWKMSLFKCELIKIAGRMKVYE